MSDGNLPDERTITTSSGETVTVRETITEVSVSASRKKQLEKYEPINEHVTLTAEKPSALVGIDSNTALCEGEFNDWLEGLADIAWAEAERGVMDRYEQYVREESFGDE